MKRKSLTAALAALCLVVALVSSAAADGSTGKTVTCGVNNVCSISSNTSGGVSHFFNGVYYQGWDWGGNHYSSKLANSNTRVDISWEGALNSWGARCSCRTGYVCGYIAPAD